MLERLSSSDLNDCIFDLGFLVDSFPSNLNDKVRTLLTTVVQANKEADLYQWLTESRPDVGWPNFLADDGIPLNPIPEFSQENLLTFLATIFEESWNAVAGKTEAAADKAEGMIFDKKAAHKYAKKIQNRYGKIQILWQSSPKPLGKIFTDVYILDKPTAWQRFNLETIEKNYHRTAYLGAHSNRQSGIELVKNTQLLYILGKPGAGKTTFLKYLTLQAAVGALGERVPVFITLRDLADSKLPILEFIVREFDVCGFPKANTFLEKMLEDGRFLLLFDGLDEISKEEDQRAHITKMIRDFVDKYDQNHVVITCRIAAAEYTFEGFQYGEVADFTGKQIIQFAKQWFGEIERVYLFMSELTKKEHRRLLDLSRSPLLLTLLCLLFDDTLKFPQERSEIYKEVIDVLLKKWDASRNIRRKDLSVQGEHYRVLTLPRKEQLMSVLAAKAFDEEKFFIKQEWLEKEIVEFLVKVPPGPDRSDIDGELVLKAMEAQHGLLVERAQGIYSFSHLTFQEYFVARYIVDNEARGSLEQFLSVERIRNDRWREIFLLVSSLLADSNHFFSMFLSCLRHIATLDRHLAEQLSWIIIKSNQFPLSNKAGFSRGKFLYLALSNADKKNLGISFAVDIHKSFNELDENVLNRALETLLDKNLIRARDLDHDFNSNHDNDLVRTLDLFLNLVDALNRSRDLTSELELDHGIDRANELANNLHLISDILHSLNVSPTLVHDLVLACELAHDLDRDLNFAINQAHHLDLDNIFDLDDYLDLYLVLDLEITRDRLNQIKDLLKEVYRPVLVECMGKLRSLAEPLQLQALLVVLDRIRHKYASSTDLESLSMRNDLNQVIYEVILDSKDWNFETKQQVELINQWINGHILLLDCLKIAVVSDREAILDQLFLVGDE